MITNPMRRRRVLTTLAAASVLAVTACGGGGSGGGQDIEILDGSDFETLVDAAQAEGQLTAYWHSGRIEAAGQAFEEMYGIRVNGTKMTDSESAERLVREVDSGNVQADVIGFDDGPRLETELIPGGYLINYVPPTAEGVVDEASLDPFVYLWQVSIIGYNTETYDQCPISNIWELTEPEWAGQLHMLDPRLRSTQIQAFSAIEDRSDELEAAYQDHYGQPLDLAEENAGLEFIARLAANSPVLYNEDVEIAGAVGARNQENPPLGLYTLGRHREIEERNLALGVCELSPFGGINQPSYALVVDGAPHPNAARLFMHFLVTEEGVSPWTGELGAYSSNPELGAHPDNPYTTVDEWGDQLLVSDNANVADRRQALLDFWIQHSS